MHAPGVERRAAQAVEGGEDPDVGRVAPEGAAPHLGELLDVVGTDVARARLEGHDVGQVGGGNLLGHDPDERAVAVDDRRDDAIGDGDRGGDEGRLEAVVERAQRHSGDGAHHEAERELQGAQAEQAEQRAADDRRQQDVAGAVDQAQEPAEQRHEQRAGEDALEQRLGRGGAARHGGDRLGGCEQHRADESAGSRAHAVDGVAEHRAARGAEERAPDQGVEQPAGAASLATVRARSHARTLAAQGGRRKLRIAPIARTGQRAARGRGSQHNAGRPRRRRRGSARRGRRSGRRGGQAGPRAKGPAQRHRTRTHLSPATRRGRRRRRAPHRARPARPRRRAARCGDRPARRPRWRRPRRTRKAFKRLRALDRVAREALGDEAYRRENTIFRDAGRRLSSARDAAVLMQTLDELTARHRDDLDDDAFAGLRDALAGEEAAASAVLADDRGAVEDVQRTLEAARRRIGGWPLPEDGRLVMLKPGFERIYRRGRRALKAARADPSTENLHELRKRAKDLWHAAQVLRPVAPKPMKQLARRAHALSDAAGDDHDLAVLRAAARERQATLAPGELALLEGLVARRRRRLQRRALAQGRRLYARKPAKVGKLVE